MLRRHITALVGVAIAVMALLGLLWLVGGPGESDGTDDGTAARLDTAAVGSIDSVRAAASGGGDTVLAVVPYRDVVPAPPPMDTAKVDPPEARKSDPEVALRPLPDTSIEVVERDLDDRELVIPVAGVKPGDLVDTYTASRSEGRTHNAIDIIAKGGTPVVAVTTGMVLKLFNSDRGGITLYQLDPDGRTVYYYAHLASYAPGIAEGQTLEQGQLLGYVGDTGNAGPGNTHLHFEITIVDSPQRFWSGTPVNPYPILKRMRVKG